MAFSEQFKHEIIAEYKMGINTSLEEFVKRKGIGKTTFYKWLKNLNNDNENFEFIDITKTIIGDVNEVVNEVESTLNIVINGASIQVGNNYNENLLIRVARSLQKI